MAKMYSIERREYWSETNPYLKVYIRKTEDMQELQIKLEALSSVKRANPNKDYFVVYNRNPYTISETQKEVELCLDKFYDRESLDELSIISESLDWYDKAKSLFESGCKKYKSRNDLRGCLDDFRLSLELLLKEILHNERTLDNQLIPLNQYLAEKGVSSEISNGFRHFLDCYNKYQNNHVKHNLNIAKNDATIIIEQTKSLINILMKLKGE